MSSKNNYFKIQKNLLIIFKLEINKLEIKLFLYIFVLNYCFHTIK